MGVSVVLKYLKQLGEGRWEYRRRVPESARQALGKGEFKRVVVAGGPSQLAREHARVDAEFERVVKAASKGGLERVPLSPRAEWLFAQARADQLLKGVSGVADEDEAREVLAESLPASEAVVIRAVLDPSALPPEYTLQDARDLYLSDYLKGAEGATGRQSKIGLDRVFGRVAEALGNRSKVALVDLRREDARKVRDFMLASSKKGGGKLSPASVRRELNQIKAVVNYALREFDLIGKAVNPFEKLKVTGETGSGPTETEGQKRQPLPDHVIKAIRVRLETTTRLTDLFLVWRLLEGTGCRLSEITGLQVDDIETGGEFPHLKVRWNEDRRLKTSVSIRSVPLVGDALSAAKEALKLPRDVAAVFPRYGRGRAGGEAASQAIMKHVHAVVRDPRYVTHSLRHNMKDRLRLARVSELEQNLILGHALGGVGDRVYGGEPVKLEVMTRAMRAAMGCGTEGITPPAPPVEPSLSSV